MIVVLDTHAWLWWLHEPDKLSTKALSAISAAEKKANLRVSVISVWEIAVKVQLGKLRLPMEITEWYQKSSAYPGLTVEALLPVDAIASAQLPGTFHKDPADRIIIALTRRHGGSLITSDAHILAYPHVKTIW